MAIIRKIERLLFRNVRPYSLDAEIPLKFHKLFLALMVVSLVLMWFMIFFLFLGQRLYGESIIQAAGLETVVVIVAVLVTSAYITNFVALKKFTAFGYGLIYFESAITVLSSIPKILIYDAALPERLVSLMAYLVFIYLFLLYYYKRRALFIGEDENEILSEYE